MSTAKKPSKKGTVSRPHSWKSFAIPVGIGLAFFAYLLLGRKPEQKTEQATTHGFNWLATSLYVAGVIIAILIIIWIVKKIFFTKKADDHSRPAPSASKGHDAHDKGGHGGHEHHDHKPDSLIRSLGVDLGSLGVGLVLLAGGAFAVIVLLMWMFKFGFFEDNSQRLAPPTRHGVSASLHSPVEVDEEPTQPPPPSTDEQQVHKTNAPVGDEWVVIPGIPGTHVEVCRASDASCSEPEPIGFRIRCRDRLTDVILDWGPGVCTDASAFYVQSTGTDPLPIFWRRTDLP